MSMAPKSGDALLVIDVQVDFVTGALAVADARAILPVVNRYVVEFTRRGLPIVASRDWHPATHSSFRKRGGPWPRHCVSGTPGAAFDPGFALPPQALIVSKGTNPAQDAYSAFDGTPLDAMLRAMHVRRIFACGLATDYCVLHTVLDALRAGYEVFVLTDAIRAVNVHPVDGDKALRRMLEVGASAMTLARMGLAEKVHG